MSTYVEPEVLTEIKKLNVKMDEILSYFRGFDESTLVGDNTDYESAPDGPSMDEILNPNAQGTASDNPNPVE